MQFAHKPKGKKERPQVGSGSHLLNVAVRSCRVHWNSRLTENHCYHAIIGSKAIISHKNVKFIAKLMKIFSMLPVMIEAQWET